MTEELTVYICHLCDEVFRSNSEVKIGKSPQMSLNYRLFRQSNANFVNPEFLEVLDNSLPNEARDNEDPTIDFDHGASYDDNRYETESDSSNKQKSYSESESLTSLSLVPIMESSGIGIKRKKTVSKASSQNTKLIFDTIQTEPIPTPTGSHVLAAASPILINSLPLSFSESGPSTSSDEPSAAPRSIRVTNRARRTSHQVTTRSKFLDFFKKTRIFSVRDISIKCINFSVRDQCAICIQSYQTNDHVRLTQCNHMFHMECLSTWFNKKKECPVCRSVFRKEGFLT